MWFEVKRTNNRITAEMWREYFEGEGISTQILPVDLNEAPDRDVAAYRVLVPQDKQHVVEEVLRKL